MRKQILRLDLGEDRVEAVWTWSTFAKKVTWQFFFSRGKR